MKVLPLLALGLVLEGAFIGIGYGVSTSTKDILPFVLLCLGAFVPYAAAVWLAVRGNNQRGAFALILVAGVLFRATLIPVAGDPYYPITDIYRYLWDGRVTSAGFNPYRYSPQDIQSVEDADDLPDDRGGGLAERQELYQLSQEPPFDRIFPNIDYADVKTIYPPLAQYLFAAAAWIRPGSFIALKALLFLLDVGTILLLAMTLRALGKSSQWVIVYAWCPLVVEEFAYAGHQDAAAIFFLVLALFLLARCRNLAAGGAMGLAILSKVFPAVLLPVLLRRAGWKSVLTAVIVVVVLTLPFASAGRDLFAGLTAYATRWKFNAGFFSLLEAGAGLLASDPNCLARISGGAVVAITALGLAWPACPHPKDALQKMLVVLSVLLLVSPVLDPWYVTWIVPLLCVFPSGPLILLTGLVFLHYLYFLEFRDPGWIRPVEFGIFYGALLVQLILKLRVMSLRRDCSRP